jgi:hypothetical protein
MRKKKAMQGTRLRKAVWAKEGRKSNRRSYSTTAVEKRNGCYSVRKRDVGRSP